jgi:hypothetical protein
MIESDGARREVFETSVYSDLRWQARAGPVEIYIDVAESSRYAISALRYLSDF